MFEHCGREWTAVGRGAQVVSGSDDRRDSRREILGVEPRNALAVDQETVSAQYDRCLDPFALSNRRDEVSNARHFHSSKSGAEAYRR